MPPVARWEGASNGLPPRLPMTAKMAGMRLTERYAGWREEPFTSESSKHISVWEKTRS